MATPLAGKVALITAGSAGLGAAIANTLASQQMCVVINYSSNGDRADALVKSLSEATSSFWQTSEEGKARFVAIKADVGDRAQIITLVDEAVLTMGRLDVVISNAGWTRFSNFHDLDEGVLEEDWDWCFNMNVKSHLFLMHAAKPHLDATEGSFITTASVAGVRPSGSSLAYAVSKAAQVHLVTALAGIVSPRIRVNCVSPGILLTDWGMKFPKEKLEAAREQNKLKRFATVEDVAEQVLVFVKSRSVTGMNAVIDAGYSL